MKIIVADDEPDLTSFLQEILTEQGHSVDTAPNGKKALELLQANSYDLAFLDHDMPEMTGIEVIKIIRKSGMKVKTVILSGYPLLKDFFVKTIGADIFVTKPFTLDEILEITKS